MTTEAPEALSQRELAARLVATIDLVRNAVTSRDWRIASADLARLVERAPSRDALRTVYVRHALGRRAEWLDRWLAER